ncbi:unnamed protein product, partial [Allacma fusca]
SGCYFEFSRHLSISYFSMSRPYGGTLNFQWEP